KNPAPSKRNLRGVFNAFHKPAVLVSDGRVGVEPIMTAVANSAQIFNRVLAALRAELAVVKLLAVSGAFCVDVHNLAIAASPFVYHLRNLGWYAVLLLFTRHSSRPACPSVRKVPPSARRTHHPSWGRIGLRESRSCAPPTACDWRCSTWPA